MDAWLIYKCIACENTWNRPVLERRQVRSSDPSLLTALRANDPQLARRLAFDAEGLRRQAGRIEASGDVAVVKEVLSASTAPPHRLEVVCAVPHPIALRMDRLLATELHLSRNRVGRLEEDGSLAVSPGGANTLHRPVRDGMRLTIHLPAADADVIAAAARSNVRDG
jgi:hypothetical protein